MPRMPCPADSNRNRNLLPPYTRQSLANYPRQLRYDSWRAGRYNRIPALGPAPKSRPGAIRLHALSLKLLAPFNIRTPARATSFGRPLPE